MKAKTALIIGIFALLTPFGASASVKAPVIIDQCAVITTNLDAEYKALNAIWSNEGKAPPPRLESVLRPIGLQILFLEAQKLSHDCH